MIRLPWPSTQEKGRASEDLALHFLQSRGHHLVARNFRCRRGELDLITLEAATLVFVEVRYRSHAGFGGAALSVDPRKQAKLIQAARYFLHQHPEHQHRDCRFDIIAFDTRRQPQWIQHAFEVSDT
ncbi:MAG: YraN family protein [Pseudomonadota bacterium]